MLLLVRLLVIKLTARLSAFCLVRSSIPGGRHTLPFPTERHGYRGEDGVSSWQAMR